MAEPRKSSLRTAAIAFAAMVLVLVPGMPALAAEPAQGLAATGWDASTVIPWVIAAAIVVVLGAVLLILARRRRSRDDR